MTKQNNSFCKNCKNRKTAPKDKQGRCVFKTHICNGLDFDTFANTSAQMGDDQSKKDHVINDLPW